MGLYLDGRIENMKDHNGVNKIYHGEANQVMSKIDDESIDLSIWSPPYFIGDYKEENSFPDWKGMVSESIRHHARILKPGGFTAINIGDILAFEDEEMPAVQWNKVSGKRVDVTKSDIESVKEEHPDWNRYDLAEHFDCSEQTIQRRLEGVNVRGGKHGTQTKVKLMGPLIEQWAEEAGLYVFDHRIWEKDPAWENSQWHSHSYRSIDDFEHIFILWKPGETVYDRDRLEKEEWSDWGSRGVWNIDSVRANNEKMKHLKKFPPELPRRLIKIFSSEGDTVLDPYVGSGTTCVQAIKQNRKYIGIDINEECVELSRENCSKATESREIKQSRLK